MTRPDAAPSLPPQQRAFAAALLDAAAPVPPGLVAWNGSDVAVRFGVYRNNVAAALVDALADTFPVVRRLVGDAFFRALAWQHARERPPRSPVLTEYGDAFADWLAAFAPVRALPYLPDLARLERARVIACHAAGAPALARAVLAQALADPARLPALRLRLQPSVQLVESRYAVVSLWAAHQQDDEDAAIGRVRLHEPEAALVLRRDDAVLVLPLPPVDARLVAQWRAGRTLGDALATSPGADLAAMLARLLGCGALAADSDTDTDTDARGRRCD